MSGRSTAGVATTRTSTTMNPAKTDARDHHSNIESGAAWRARGRRRLEAVHVDLVLAAAVVGVGVHHAAVVASHGATNSLERTGAVTVVLSEVLFALPLSATADARSSSMLSNNSTRGHLLRRCSPTPLATGCAACAEQAPRAAVLQMVVSSPRRAGRRRSSGGARARRRRPRGRHARRVLAAHLRRRVARHPPGRAARRGPPFALQDTPRGVTARRAASPTT